MGSLSKIMESLSIVESVLKIYRLREVSIDYQQMRKMPNI